MKIKSQKSLFEHVWDTRDHFSELTGEPLLPKTHSQWHWQFLHVLPKGTYPSQKMNPDNILLGLPEEHEKQEQYEVFTKKRQELTRLYHEGKL